VVRMSASLAVQSIISGLHIDGAWSGEYSLD
jgi:hypothetical protein